MNKAGLIPAPYILKESPILSRKDKNYKQEIKHCETYIDAVEKFYKKNHATQMADVRKGTRYQSIVKRLPKAKNLSKNKTRLITTNKQISTYTGK